jgi:Uma2 family endonuclease
MPELARKKVTYDDLYDIPENMTGQIIDGEMIVTPRPSARHSHAASTLGGEVVPPYRFGRSGGPGGWIILYEQELMFGEHLLVPDFSGWRKERFPGVPQENWISVPPDWVCEILSPGTARVDRVRKMPIYARNEIPFLWLIDPTAQTLEAYRLEAGKWLLLGAFAENDKFRAEPFQEIEMDLGNFWLE